MGHPEPSDSAQRAVVYTRRLPGGGFVTIETQSRDDQTLAARLLVERRSDPERRLGHEPPVIAEFVGPQDVALPPLRSIAADNVALAQAIMRWQAQRARGAR